MKKVFADLFATLLFIAGFILFFAVVFMFAWNVGVLWLFQDFHGLRAIGFGNAIALATIGVITHFVFNFWTTKIILMRNTFINQKYLQLEEMKTNNEAMKMVLDEARRNRQTTGIGLDD